MSHRIAVVLAGGRATRLSGVWDRPKILAELDTNRVFLDWLVTYLEKQGFDELLLLLGHKSDEVISYITNIKSKIYISYQVEVEPLGTGGAVIELIKNRNIQAPEIWIFNGDTFYSKNLPHLFLDKNISNQENLLLTKITDQNIRYGSVSKIGHKLLFDRGDARKNQPLIRIYIGAARIKVKFLKDIKISYPCSFEEVLSNISLKQASDVFRFIDADFDFLDFGVPEDFKKLKLFRKFGNHI